MVYLLSRIILIFHIESQKMAWQKSSNTSTKMCADGEYVTQVLHNNHNINFPR